MTKKILLTHGFFLSNDTKQFHDKFKPYPPLATLYLAGGLREVYGNVYFFDSILEEGLDNFIDYFHQIQPDALVIYEDDFNFLTKMCLIHVRETTFAMAELASRNKTPVIVHSSDATDKASIYLSAGVDYVIKGEGDVTTLELLKQLFSRSLSPDSIPDGIAYQHNGKTRHSKNRPPMRNIENIPQPAWDLIDHKRYREAWYSRHGFYSLNLVTTRGCPYHCNWCAKPIWGQQYVSHSPQYIVDQLSILSDLARPDHIWFSDDIFGLNKKWVIEFSNLMREASFKVPFMVQSRADLMDEGMVSALSSAGCNEVWLGIESGSQRILDAMDKGLKISDVKCAIDQLKSEKIKTGFFIQLGYISESFRDITMTRELLIQYIPDVIGVSVSYPLPGTGFYQKVKAQIREKENWTESNDLSVVFNATYTSDFYGKIRNHFHDLIDALNLPITSNSRALSLKDLDQEWYELRELSESFKYDQSIDTISLCSR